MRIAPWRLVLTGGAIVILAAASLGLALAAAQPAGDSGSDAVAAASHDPDATRPPGDHLERDGRRFGHRGGGWPLRLGRHLVHAEITAVGRDGELVRLQLDHGTITAIGDGSLTVAEADGNSVTVATDDETRVRLGREPGALSDLAIGDEVLIHSRLDGDSPVARHVVRLPAMEGAS